MCKVLQLHEAYLPIPSASEDPKPCEFCSQSPLGLLSDRCMHQSYVCVLRERNGVRRCVGILSGYKITNRQATECLPSQDSHSNEAGMQKERLQTAGNSCHHKMYTVLQIHWQARGRLPSQDVHSNTAGMRKERLPSPDVHSM